MSFIIVQRIGRKVLKALDADYLILKVGVVVQEDRPEEWEASTSPRLPILGWLA